MDHKSCTTLDSESSSQATLTDSYLFTLPFQPDCWSPVNCLGYQLLKTQSNRKFLIIKSKNKTVTCYKGIEPKYNMHWDLKSITDYNSLP